MVCRWLAAPSNLEADTLSDLLFAISGAAPAYAAEYPLGSAIDCDTSQRVDPTATEPPNNARLRKTENKEDPKTEGMPQIADTVGSAPPERTELELQQPNEHSQD